VHSIANRGQEFGYGFYDGITGLVTQPLRGAEKEGAAGLVKGIGKGIGGLILKPGAGELCHRHGFLLILTFTAIWGLPGYAFKGIHKEVMKMFGSSIANYIIAARTTQGYEDAKNSTKEERADIINRWRLHKDEYQSSRMKIHESGGPEGQESGRLTPKGFMQTRHLTFEERKKLHEERKVRREAERKRLEAEQGPHSHRFCPFCRRTAPHTHEPHTDHSKPIVGSDTGDDHFEQAIHASVAATSRGNADEDLMIERAIRASVWELQSSQESTLTDEEALSRAIQASISEASRKRSDEQNPAFAMTDEEAEHQALLEKAIQASLAQYQFSTRGDAPAEDPAAEEDDNIKLALQMSKEEMNKDEAATLLNEEKEIELALQKSKDDLIRTKTEEEIVLEYVRKQSLLEEEHKKAAAVKKTQEMAAPPTPASTIEDHVSPADEEALRKAIEESMKSHHGGASESTS
jgi:hypothetical protein